MEGAKGSGREGGLVGFANGSRGLEAGVVNGLDGKAVLVGKVDRLVGKAGASVGKAEALDGKAEALVGKAEEPAGNVGRVDGNDGREELLLMGCEGFGGETANGSGFLLKLGLNDGNEAFCAALAGCMSESWGLGGEGFTTKGSFEALPREKGALGTLVNGFLGAGVNG